MIPIQRRKGFVLYVLVMCVYQGYIGPICWGL